VGDVEEGAFSTWWTDENGAVMAAFVLNRPDEERESAKNCVAEQSPMPAEYAEAADN
jgi:hypothetical protein